MSWFWIPGAMRATAERGQAVSRAHIGGAMTWGDEKRPPMVDVERRPPPGPAPEPGAQWDEVLREWQRWDQATEAWIPIPGGPGQRDEAVGSTLPGMPSESDETHMFDALKAHTRMVTHVGEHHEPVDDVGRNAIPAEPPVEGAQWDEVHRRWETWDADAQEWVAHESAIDSGVAPADENPLPPQLARELVLGEDLEAKTGHIDDVERAAEPTEGPPGAQWNEVENRWERWDEASNAWVEAT